MSRWEKFKNRLLGEKCDRCLLRVYPRYQAEHDKDCDLL